MSENQVEPGFIKDVCRKCIFKNYYAIELLNVETLKRTTLVQKEIAQLKSDIKNLKTQLDPSK